MSLDLNGAVTEMLGLVLLFVLSFLLLRCVWYLVKFVVVVVITGIVAFGSFLLWHVSGLFS